MSKDLFTTEEKCRLLTWPGGSYAEKMRRCDRPIKKLGTLRRFEFEYLTSAFRFWEPVFSQNANPTRNRAVCVCDRRIYLGNWPYAVLTTTGGWSNVLGPWFIVRLSRRTVSDPISCYESGPMGSHNVYDIPLSRMTESDGGSMPLTVIVTWLHFVWLNSQM